MISKAVSSMPFLVGQLLDWPASAYPDRPALEWEGGSLTFAELTEAVKERQELLRDLGAGKGQRWGLLLGNTPDFIVSLFALLRLGCVAVPLRCHLLLEKLAYQIRLAHLDGVLTCQELEEPIRKLGWEESALLSQSELRAFISCEPSTRNAESMQLIDLDPALILLTSGSTGQARGVVLEHHAILANLRSNIASLGLRDDDRTLVVLPLSHAYALVNQCLCHLMIGATVCLLPNALASPLLHHYLDVFRITTLSTVPPVLQILTAGLKRSKASLPALRLLTVGAAFADRQVVTELLSLLPDTRLAVTYGLTEAGPRVSTHFVERGELFNPECVGLPLPNVAIGLQQLVDGRQEIVLRSRSTMSGYLEDGKDSAEVVGVKLRTGDIGYMSQGELYLNGRKDRAINRGGTMVDAEQIESVLLTHPAIASGRVERAEHPFWGEVPVATVTLAADAVDIDEEELREYCASRLSAEERPFRFVIQPSGSLFGPSKTQELASLVRQNESLT